MLLSIVTLLASASLTLANDMAGVYDFNSLSYEDILTRFQTFVQDYSRQYKDAGEAIMRLQIFTNNLRQIVEMNNKAGKPIFGITQFADYTQDKLDEMMPAYKGDADLGTCQQGVVSSPGLGDLTPEELDWRKKGAVTRVKSNQGCRCSYAFAAMGAVEGAQVIGGKPLVALSEQQVLECDTENNGVKGGSSVKAIEYVLKKGVASEKDYPYRSQNGQVFECKEDSFQPAGKISGCVLHKVEENTLRELLAKTGPLVIALSFGSELGLYQGGIVEDCPANELNYNLLLVGYGTDNGVPYWTLKTSFTEHFGEQGYIRVKRDVNACNMTFAPVIQAVPYKTFGKKETP